MTALVIGEAVTATAATYPVAPDEIVKLVTENTIKPHIKFLGDRLLEGRLPGSNGELLAAKYLESQLMQAGIAPAGDNGTYFQRVATERLKTIDTTPLTLTHRITHQQVDLAFMSDYVSTTEMWGNSVDSVILDHDDLVFVGYGITAPSLGWDDYKDVDVRGKVVISLVSQPTTGAVWAGQPLMYQGRWTYKFEEASRRGAKGCLLVHTPETASYGWNVIQSGWGNGETRSPVSRPSHPLMVTGWVSQEKADLIASLFGGGSTLSQWFKDASSRDFKPLLLNASASVKLRFTTEAGSGLSVVGALFGSSAKDEAVVLSAHVDHLGVRNDGQVFSGAIDNGSGMAVLLSIASTLGHQCANRSLLQRTVVFLFPTAEECGLFGSSTFLATPPSSLKNTKFIADINYDMPNAWGKTSDVALVGACGKDLASVLSFAASGESLSVSGDPTPPASGFAFRGDQFSFVKAGIPAVWLFTGSKFVGQPDDYFQKVVLDGYFGHCYHQPCDNTDSIDSIDFSGMIQMTRVGVRAVFALANSNITPTCPH